ncbi:hypothetical protein RCO22_10860 [Pseudomonas yamanorum]|uniref:Uncharacterized protein n=1 Tax=Pseudomonas yamanorum TaxID=515393 RepID=A0ABU1CQ90_9PSED|nr:hypothetical protein [Pseudomonas yamanorum]MDR0189439.1 hypothetical protein [Pseudomonas yamanorum]
MSDALTDEQKAWAQFAAAALTGLLASGKWSSERTAAEAASHADMMLGEMKERIEQAE